MQTYFWQVLIDGEPWQNAKIWNEESAKVVYERVKSNVENHIDYKGENVELVKLQQ